MGQPRSEFGSSEPQDRKKSESFNKIASEARAGMAQSIWRLARDRWSGDRIPVWARFSARVQTGPWASHSSILWVPGLFSGVKRTGRDVDHTHLCRG